MSQLEIFNQFVCEVFEIPKDELNDDLTPDDVENWTSVSHMELMGKFEETFGLELDVEDITEMDSIGNMKRILRENYAVDL